MKKDQILIPENLSPLQFFHFDGMLDLVIAAILINFGLDIFNNSEFTSLFTWVPILLFNSIKYNYTLKRIPAALFGEDSKKLRMWIFLPTLFLVAAVIFLSFIVLQDSFNLSQISFLSLQGNTLTLVSGFIIAVFCLIPALWIPLKRFYVYSAAALGIAFVNFFVLPGYAFFFATGLVIAIFGGMIVFRFSKAYPVIETPKKDDET